MWSSRVSVVSVIAVLAVALSCGGSSKPTTLSSSWAAPSILAQVPADSPYVFATLQPIDEKLRRRLLGTLNQNLAELLKTAAQVQASDRAGKEPFVRAMLAVADELRGKDLNNWWRELGFDPNGRFALYGLSVWPVARIELADANRVRGVLERLIAAAGIQPQRATLDGHAYLSFPVGSAEMTVVAAVLEHEAVVAFVPASALAAALPLVLGTQKPAHPLGATTTVTDLLAHNHFVNVVLGYVDFRSLLAIMAGPTPGPLDVQVRAKTGPIPAACSADLARMVAAAPRMAFGYRRFDERGFDGAMVVETAPSVVTAFRRMHASVPELTTPVSGHPLFALGAALNPDELIAWLRGVTTELHDHPFTCPWFDGANRAAAELADKLATPLPPMVRGVRGFSLVVDRLTISPFDVEGHVLIAGDHAPDLVSMLTSSIPFLPNIPVKPDGRPVEIPTKQLNLPVRSAHVAMTPDRIVIAAGTNSAQRATAHLATPAPRSSPLGLMAFDMPRLQALLASINSKDLAQLNHIGDLGMSFDATDDGVGFEVWGTWRDPEPVIAK
jgi:hypothetical protein